MAENSAIEWCDSTFNPWIGCSRVGPGCDHCYAEALSKARLGVAWGPGAPRRRTAASTWAQPRRWERAAAAFLAKHGRRQRVFCASLADVFDNEVPAEWRLDLFHLILDTPHLDWLLVTKRVGNVEKMMTEVGFVPGNFWLGITVVNQAEATRDIPKLAQAKRMLGIDIGFLSIEPLLGPIDLTPDLLYQPCPSWIDNPPSMDPSTGMYECCRRCDFTGVGDELVVNWVIVGGESGLGARPMHPDWVRSLRDQCAAGGVQFMFKQWGEWSPERTRAAVRPEDAGQLQRFTIVSSTCRKEVGATVFYGMPASIAERGITEVDCLRRVGKKAAGRLLDGAQHDGSPA